MRSDPMLYNEDRELVVVILHKNLTINGMGISGLLLFKPKISFEYIERSILFKG
jgi:hypothetical protein